MSSRVVLYLLALTSGACGASNDGTYRFVVHVESEPDEPVAGATLLHRGRALATTDAEGGATLEWRGRQGTRVKLQLTCPPGFQHSEGAIQLLLEEYQGKAVPEISARCAPEKARLAIVVRTENAPALPIFRDDERIGAVGGNGIGHALLEAPINSHWNVLIDTSAEPDLLPRNPSFRVQVGAADDVTVLEQAFERTPPIQPKPRVAQRKALPKLPVRLQ